ncbi:MAG: sodium-dependent transporter [Tissierellia bacterium]|nr:sodium-dependent transporter [Tissierellia bacterium]
MENQSKDRGSFSKLGFILAAAGSSIGLGNLWKFPYLTGSNGGGVFVIVYLVIIATIGFTCMLGEMAIGKYTKLNPIGAYGKIAEKWKFVGVLGVLVPFLIVTYYNIIGGWIMKYIVESLLGHLPAIAGDSANFFTAHITASTSPIVYTLIFVIINAVIIQAGVNEGIERASKILMPLLFVLLLIVAFRSVTLPGAVEGIKFYLQPDFSKLSFNTVTAALGQCFFSLSLGMGAMITYGSYLPDNSHIEQDAVLVPLLDTFAALLAGFAILPAVFAFGFEPSAGPGLIFITLPAVFDAMPFGTLWATVFFFLVLFAAITSSVSLVENPTAWLIDSYGMDRKKAAWIVCIVAFLIAIPESLSMGVWSGITFPPMGLNIFDEIGYIAESLLMPAAGFFMCIVIGWVWGIDNFAKAVTNNGEYEFKSKKYFEIMVKYVAPAAIFFIWLNSSGILSIFS